MQPHRVSLTIFAVTLLAFGLATSTCWGWGDGGHMAVALRAWDALTPAQRDAAVSLLKLHPRFEKDFAARMPAAIPPADRDKWIFAIAATWPDYVWQLRLTDPRDFHKYFHPAWHVIGETVTLDPNDPNPPKRWMPDGKDIKVLNVKQALPYITAQLNDSHLPAADRAVALCWVMHLTGDLHEPCHTASLFSHRFTVPDGDHVATQLPVFLSAANAASGHTTPLHGYWDSLYCTSTVWSQLLAWDAGVLEDPALQPAALPELQEHPTSDQWVAESHELAVHDVYTPDIRAAVAAQDGEPSKAFEPIRLSDDYMRHAREIGRRRGALAGLRLADTLSHVQW
ncbi:MAG TPA: S1/P1 nuclease [Tepidisphaeraceae bacterium]